MLAGVEHVLLTERPDLLLVYGDTNSTLAGALAAAKLSIPVAHVEAGLRSFNRSMPEEVNRVVTDHLAAVLLCPSESAAGNLAAEGVRTGVHVVGDVMLDVLNWARGRAIQTRSGILERLDVTSGSYVLATVHRSENTNDGERLASILAALEDLDETVVFPVHPRTRKAIGAARGEIDSNLRMIDPVGYLDMVALAANARLVITDSGGLQKEAYWLGVPCLTTRNETEWIETVEAGWNLLVGADRQRIIDAARTFAPPAARPCLYGDGAAAPRCVDLLERNPEVGRCAAARSGQTEERHERA